MSNRPAFQTQGSERRLRIRHVAVLGRGEHLSAANGVHNVMRHLVREQCSMGHEARLVLLSYPSSCLQATNDDRAHVVPIAGPSVRGRVVRLRRGVTDAVLAGADDRTVFHIHGGREPMLVGLAQQMHVRGLPYALTIHGRFSHVYGASGECLNYSTALYLRVFERGLLTRARFVHALSGAEERILRRIAPDGAVRVVSNGAYSSQLGPAPTGLVPRLRSAGFPHFVFCGRYAIHHKGLDLLLDGFARYRRSGGRGHLTTVGSGPLTELRQWADALGISAAVTLHGAQFGSDRDAMLRSADFFVMPSRYEGLPLAALEAALLCLPLIVTEATGLADRVAAFGAGVPIQALSAAGVCEAFHRAGTMSAAEWTAQCASAHRLAVSIGDWSTIAARLCQLYECAGTDHWST